jgi:glycosyltransferase involved in cell wall biosynthesis
MNFLISVIISTYNAADRLNAVLSRYCVQTDQNFEIVIADDGSNADHRRAYEQHVKNMKIPVRIVWHRDDGFRKTAILNKAIIESTGRYLIFTDGDCIPEAKFVAAHRKKARNGRFLSGTKIKLNETQANRLMIDHDLSVFPTNVTELLGNSETETIRGTKVVASMMSLGPVFEGLDPTKKSFNGCNASCWHSDAVAAGGFDERMGYGGEDVEFGVRLSNSGIQGKGVRYSALCGHIPHGRPYANPIIIEANQRIIANTRLTCSVRTEFGLEPLRAAI